ncbi:uncharacterized protein LOC110224871 [Arabidopsis lyrata subsp. lyrata]|uniref:uncharacterized protein LOC110224871 n=1 Tax=Arabidopsis lyrata subsp. lyrata TaxID=81972 RepID=UPI000A29DE53|nr:uncharacterized protein LOC110224871 [Arabidopsis lyrata subsp. lyrata]|eukprot:XP_020868126.1 uncharacterized protein LOC110224871 [Arabidopsis lyrata subsp. lyrata]
MSEILEESPRVSSPKTKGSWVSVVQNKQVLQKFDINVTTSEGKNSVEIPDEVFENATPLWEDFLVVNFLNTAPHVAKVHVILNKIWKQGADSQKIDVYEVNSTTQRFRVCDPLVRARILKRGMWNIAEVPMVVSKWSPITERDQPEEKSIPLWVYLKQVPLNMYSWEGLSFITSAVGIPVRLHPETAACSNFDVAKVFVRADLSKELPKKICFSKNGTDFWVDFSYPWLPPRCTICDKWGHLETRCVANLKKSEISSQEVPKAIESKSLVEISSQEVPNLSIVLEKGASIETEQVAEKVTTEMSQEASTNIVDANGDDTDQWTTVSPSKASRSPNKDFVLQQNTALPVASASKFAVLSVDEEEEGEIRENAEGKEEEINTVEKNGETVQIQEDVVKVGAEGVVNPPATRVYKKKRALRRLQLM